MNATSTKTIIHCAILLCSTTVPKDEKLDLYTGNYLKSKGFTVNQQSITEQLEKHNTGAKLYGCYRDSIARIQKISLIQEVYRFLWIYNFVSKSYETLSPAQLLSIVNDKYENEKLYDEELDRNKFSAFKLIDREFCTNEYLNASGRVLGKFSNDYDNALKRLSETFLEVSGMEYMSEIYSIESIVALKESSAKKSDSPRMTMHVTAFSEKNKIPHEKVDVDTTTQASAQSSKVELQLRDEIRILKNDKHDLEVKLSYAKKDAIREFMSTLTDYGWNCPLSELYRLLKDDNTPEKIKGIINNLFMALGSENVKLCRDKIGDEVILNEENQKIYEPYKYEQLFLGDKAEIFYPGYKYGREMMVRPVVRGIKEKEKDLNENG